MMLKKVFSTITLVSLLITTNIGYFSVSAVDTNNMSTPWTIEKARHLAKKALLGASEQKINQLFAVGSAENAVNVLFPSRGGPSRTDFEEMLNTMTSDPGFNPGNAGDMYEYYLTKKTFDPYEAKSKLFLMIEDIYAVNTSGSKDITYLDIENTHDLLYSHTLGSYKEMVKRNLFNNGNGGDYSIAQFLDLLDQTDPVKPNQNYAREILQLLTMGENIPGETPENGGIRNYTETEVNNLAKILVGFESNENTHAVTYNNAINTNTTIEFLDGDLKAGDSFPFYSGSGIIDVQALKVSIDGNNGLPDNIVDYIFSKREDKIALFLADKLYRFYVEETPTRNQLDTIANQLIMNNFDLYLTVKWLLAHDMMYTSESMNSVIYKNPIELVSGTAKILGLSNVLNIDNSMRTLGWTPYFPGSIFGRDGFDQNKDFFNTTTSIRWASEASRIVNEMDIDTFIDKSFNLNELIADLENKFYGSEVLPADIKQKLVNFMSLDENGDVVVFDLNDDTYNNYYTKTLIHMMLIQPEYVLQSGSDQSPNPDQASRDFYDSENKLITVYFGGGLDWLHAIVPQDEYPEYLEKRLTGALIGEELIELDDDYYINASMAPFKELYDSGDLKVINRVGTENHSRSHSDGRYMMTSLNNERSRSGEGIIGNFIENEDPLKTLTLGRGGVEFRGGKTMNVGSDGLYRITDRTNNDFRIHKISTLKDIYTSRTYPEDLDIVFENGVFIANVAEASVANGGRSGAGSNMTDNFIFAENLFDAGISNVLSMHADGGYDSHRNQKNGVNRNLERVAQRTADFYNRVKDRHNVTIVLYSEFGRTTQINSSVGTDHGKGGGMFILTNNEELKTSLPEKVYGNNSFVNAQANRLGVGIDYRGVYNRIFKDLFNQDLSEGLGKDYDILDYVDNSVSDSELFRVEFREDRGQTYARINFQVDDENFIFNQGSHIEFFHGSDQDNLREIRYRDVNRMVKDNVATLNIGRLPNESEYFYKINIYDNQYNLKVLEGSFITPQVNSRDNFVLNVRGNTRFPNFTNRNISGTQMLTEGNQIILSGENPTTFFGENNMTMTMGTGTVVEALETDGDMINWDGTFILLDEVPVDDFIDGNSMLGTEELEYLTIDKVVKVGADSLGVGMKLNKSVQINIPGVSTTKNYAVLSSEDGENWEQIEPNNVTKNGSNISFTTDHFTFFALAESNSNGSPVVDTSNRPEPEPTPGTPSNPDDSNSGGFGLSRSGGGGGGLGKRDNCKYGDYSPSYFDRSCGKSVDAKELYILAQKQNGLTSVGYNDENDLINYAVLDLQEFEGDKYNLYTQLFSDINSSKSDKEKVLILLREDTSKITVNGYEFHYIKGGNKNEVFKKIAQLFMAGKYSDKHKQRIADSINELILSFTVANMDGISNKTKQKAKEELKFAITSLKYNYKLAKSSTKSVIYTAPKKEVYSEENTKKTKEYYQSRKAAILRQHGKK